MSRRWARKRMLGRARLLVETTIKARSAWIFTFSKLLLMKQWPLANPSLGLVPCADDARPEWVAYSYLTSHPILRWLPSKLAEWLAENLAEELAIPAKLGDKWTVEELNTVLERNLVSDLRTFGAIQWECELYRGRPKARCYPFNLDGHRFRGKNPQVK